METNYFPLWEADQGQFRLTYLPKKPKPVKAFTQLMGRFSHLTQEELEEFQKMVNARFEKIRLQCIAHS